MSSARLHPESDSTLTKQGPDPGVAVMPTKTTTKHKKTKRLSWTLGRKKARDEQAYVADRNGERVKNQVTSSF